MKWKFSEVHLPTSTGIVIVLLVAASSMRLLLLEASAIAAETLTNQHDQLASSVSPSQVTKAIQETPPLSPKAVIAAARSQEKEAPPPIYHEPALSEPVEPVEGPPTPKAPESVAPIPPPIPPVIPPPPVEPPPPVLPPPPPVQPPPPPIALPPVTPPPPPSEAFLASKALASEAAKEEPPPSSQVSGNMLFSGAFSQYPEGIITNEFAYWSKNDPAAKISPHWELTSGSLFAKDGVAWTGVPDAGTAPNALSSNANNSAIFRLTTKKDFGDVAVAFDLLNQELVSTPHTPAVDWDGVHIFLRYQSQYHLYYATVNRRDNKIVIKKKVPNGPSNGGTYHNISTWPSYTVPYGRWQKIEATVKNNADGSVTIKLFADGKLLVEATDNGIGGAPITAPGKVGIRTDNADIMFKNFTVKALE